MTKSSPRFEHKTVDVSQFHRNVSQEVVEITVDRLKLILSQHLTAFEKANEWQAALGIFLAIAITLVTADFKTAFGVQGDVWKSLFIVGACVALFWLFRSLVRLFREDSISELINRIKSDDQI